MSLKKYISSAWQEIDKLQKYVSGAWVSCTSAKKYSNSAWTDIWNDGIYIIRNGVLREGVELLNYNSDEVQGDGYMYYQGDGSNYFVPDIDPSVFRDKTIYVEAKALQNYIGTFNIASIAYPIDETPSGATRHNIGYFYIKTSNGDIFDTTYRVYNFKYNTDWDKYLPKATGGIYVFVNTPSTSRYNPNALFIKNMYIK